MEEDVEDVDVVDAASSLESTSIIIILTSFP